MLSIPCTKTFSVSARRLPQPSSESWIGFDPSTLRPPYPTTKWSLKTGVRRGHFQTRFAIGSTIYRSAHISPKHESPAQFWVSISTPSGLNFWDLRAENPTLFPGIETIDWRTSWDISIPSVIVKNPLRKNHSPPNQNFFPRCVILPQCPGIGMKLHHIKNFRNFKQF